MTKYCSKIDHWLWILIMATMLAGVFAPIFTEPSIDGTSLLILLISTLLPSLLIWNIYTDTHYTIFDDTRTLRVKSGFIVNSRYDICKITRIRNTRTWLSSPALSIDRIEISFGRYNRVVISPLHKEAFINHLLSLNPNIQAEA